MGVGVRGRWRCCFIEKRISRVFRSVLLVFRSPSWVLVDVCNLCRFLWDDHLQDVNSAVMIPLFDKSFPACLRIFLLVNKM